MDILVANNLSKTYGKNETRVEALKNASINIQKGSMVAVIGPSGSGKTTFLHLLGALDYPTSGKVIIDGTNIFSLKESDRVLFRRRKIGFVFQSYNLIPALNVEENIIMPILLDHKKPDMEYVDTIISMLGLTNRRNHLPSQLSGGQQQRAAIGRALASKPSVILADEPTGNLDSKNGKDILNLLKLSVKDLNQTLVIITHNMAIAETSDRIMQIEDGILSECGSVDV